MQDIIDKNDNVIGTKPRADVQPGELIRFVHVYIFDDKNNLVLQQRGEGRMRPNLLCASAGGHVDAGEGYETAAHRELKEELGIETELEFVCDSWGEYGLCKVFKGIYTGVLSPCEVEVKNVGKFPFHEVVELHRRYPFVLSDGFYDSFARYEEAIYKPLSLVNDADIEIGGCKYDDMRKNKLLVRVVHVLVRNSKGEFLLQHRSLNVAAAKLRLDSAASGHVDVGESYKIAAMREAKEELGFDVDLTNVEPFLYEKLSHTHKFCQAFAVTYDGDITFEKDEIENITWLCMEDIDMMIEKMPFIFTNSFIIIYNKYKETLGE